MPGPERLTRLSRELAFAAFARPGAPSLKPWFLDRLAAKLDERRLRAGETLYLAGEPGDTLYFMTQGSVRLSREGSPDWTLAGRWVIGSMDLILERPRNRTAVAVTDLELVTVDGETWLELIEDNHEVARMIVENSLAGLAMLYTRLGPDAAFEPPVAAPSLPLPDGPLDLVERLLVLSDVALLREAGVQTLANLAAGAQEVSFAAGAEVLARGAERDRLLIVADGLVEAAREGPAVSGRFGPGALVAGGAALGPPSLAWRAHAVQPTRALAVAVESFFDEIEEHFDMVRAALTAMTGERERLLDRVVTRAPGTVFQ